MRIPRVFEPLRHRNFRLLWLGQTVSILGNFIYAVALPFQILALGGSALQLGIGASISSVTLVVSLLFAGAIVDRLPRRRVILVSDLACGLLMTAIAVLGLTGTLVIEHLYVAAAFFGVAFAFVGPAISAIIPELIPQDVLVPGNAMRGLSRQIALASGPVIGGAVVALAGPPAAFVLNAVSFFVSFAAVWAVRDRARAPSLPPPLLRQIREGLSFTFSVPWLWITIFLWAFVNMAETGPFIVGLPLLVRDVLLGDARMYGAILAAMGIGEIIGTFTVSQLHVRRTGLVMYGWGLLSGVTYVVIGLVPLLPVILAMALLRGVCSVGFGVLWESALQRHVPREMLGRVASIDWFGAVLMGPLAPIVFAAVVETYGPATAYLIGGVAVVALLLPSLAVRSIREME